MKENKEQVVNIVFLNDSLCGNHAMIVEIIDLFVQQIPNDLSVIRSALDKGDFQTIEIRTHKLKSSLFAVGVISLNEVLNEIETLAREKQDLSHLSSSFQQVAAVCMQAVEELAKEKNRIKGQNKE